MSDPARQCAVVADDVRLIDQRCFIPSMAMIVESFGERNITKTIAVRRRANGLMLLLYLETLVSMYGPSFLGLLW